jgi:hypothetical protein
VRVNGYLYDKEAEKQMVSLGHKRVNGYFKLSFVIVTVVTMLSALVSLILVLPRLGAFIRVTFITSFRSRLMRLRLMNHEMATI